MMKTKVCSKCKQEKSISEFNKHSEGKLGVRPDCKMCSKAYARNRYETNKENYLKRNREWRFNNKDYMKSYNSDYREKNRDYLSNKAKVYRIANLEKLKEYSKRYLSIPEIKEKKYAYHKEWYSKNYQARKYIYVEIGSTRRARKLLATPSWSNSEAIRNIYKECDLISKETGIKHHVDHIIPLRGRTVSGLHVETNLRIVPASENLSKSSKLIEDLL